MFVIFLICNELAARDFAGEGLNNLARKVQFFGNRFVHKLTSKNQNFKLIIDLEQAQGSNSFQLPDIHLQYSQWRASEVMGRKTDLI